MRKRPESDMLSEQFSALVREGLERQGLSVTDLAKRLGISRPVVSRTLNQPGSIQSATVVAYFEALGLDPDLRAKRKSKQTKPPKEGAQDDHDRHNPKRRADA